MKKFNKVLALGMAGSMALSMAACGGSSSSASTGTDGSSTSTAAPTAAPSKDVVTLKWVAVGSGMPSNYDAWLAQINPYLEDKIGVNIRHGGYLLGRLGHPPQCYCEHQR